MNRISKIIACLGLGGIVLAGCQNKEAELLASKVYFEDVQTLIEIDKEATHTIDLKARLTSKFGEDVKVTYTIEGEDVVNAYNEKYGKLYKTFTTAGLAENSASILAGDVYSGSTELYLNELGELVDGDSYLLPVRVQAEGVPVIDGSDITYYEVKRPLKIMKAAQFNNSHITLPLTPLDVFTDVTFEAVINVSRFGDNNTVMGCEGIMIMRIGDAGGGTVPRDVLQMAGKSELIYSDGPLKTGLWYHLAFTCTADGKANLYVNGERVVEGPFTMSADLTANGANYGFSIGKVPYFMWGQRPFYGYMSEVRLWNVARSATQIKEGMLSVDPKSDGLVAYYKMNGDGIVNATGGAAPREVYNIKMVDLEKPVEIGGTLK